MRGKLQCVRFRWIASASGRIADNPAEFHRALRLQCPVCRRGDWKLDRLHIAAAVAAPQVADQSDDLPFGDRRPDRHLHHDSHRGRRFSGEKWTA